MKSALVVDDSLTIRKLVGSALKAAGFTVTEAPDGKQALEKLAALPPPAVVVTDINMPVMDGIELIKAIRARAELKFTPIICLTTESDDAKKNEGREAGATGWVVKPFDVERLMKAIQKVVP